MLTHISVRGAREHNLKGVDIDIPRESRLSRHGAHYETVAGYALI